MQMKKWFQNLDLLLIGAICLLAVFGILCIASALHFNLGEGSSEVYKQIAFFLIGLVLMIVAANVDYEYFSQFYIPIYFVNLLLLLAVFLLGNESNGATRWIQIGPLTIQPSEFAKVMMIFFLAKYISLHHSKMNRLDFFPETMRHWRCAYFSGTKAAGTLCQSGIGYHLLRFGVCCRNGYSLDS